MYEFDELYSYSAAAVVVDGLTRYEVRHYGGAMLHRFTSDAEPEVDGDGRQVIRVAEWTDGPTEAFDMRRGDASRYREPVPARELRPYVLEWAYRDGTEAWREVLGNGPADMACALLAEWSATAAADTVFVRDEAARLVSDAFDTGDGPSLSTSDARGAWSILWNLAGKPCAHCGAEPDDTPYPETVVLFRDPLYVYGGLPVCADCADELGNAYTEGGDRPTAGGVCPDCGEDVPELSHENDGRAVCPGCCEECDR